MAFSLPDLPYAHDALASKGMSAETLVQQHQPAVEPQPVLGNDGAGHVRNAGRAGKGDC